MHFLTGGIWLTLPQEVSPPHLQRVNAQPLSQHVHMRFYSPVYLDVPETAKGVYHGGIGIDSVGVPL